MSKTQAPIQRRGDPSLHRVQMISEAVVARYIHDLAVRGRRERSTAGFRVNRPAPVEAPAT